MSREVEIVLGWLRENQHVREDAETYSRVDNTIAGSTLSILYGIPRWRAEQAVKEALAELRRRERRKKR